MLRLKVAVCFVSFAAVIVPAAEYFCYRYKFLSVVIIYHLFLLKFVLFFAEILVSTVHSVHWELHV